MEIKSPIEYLLDKAEKPEHQFKGLWALIKDSSNPYDDTIDIEYEEIKSKELPEHE